MKSVLLLCLMTASSLAADLRIIGTNVFDFTLLNHSTNHPYWINGWVDGPLSNGIWQIRVHTGQREWRFDPKKARTQRDIDEINRAEKIQRLSERDFAKLDSRLQQHFSRYYITRPIYVRNLHHYRSLLILNKDDPIHELALPTTAGYYDCGIPIMNGVLTNYPVYYRVTLKGIIRVPPQDSVASTNSLLTKTNASER